MNSLIVIGGGPGGYVAAFAAARAGVLVTLIEQEAMGGTCLNKGCVPTKTLKASAEALALAKRLAEFGINGCAEPTVDMPTVIARKNRVRGILTTGLEKACASLKIRRIMGKAELAGSGKVLAHTAEGTEELFATHIILATGSEHLAIPSLPVDHKHIITSDDALELQSVPERVIIVGGGVIGCEMAFILHEFGAKVTIVEGQNRLLPLPAVDEDISRLMQREAKKNRIATVLAATVQSATVQADGSVECKIGPSPFVADSTVEEHTLVADMVLVSVGRVPCTAGLGLDKAGVETDARGWIKADMRMRTSAKGIYAVGDILGPSRIMLAHVASAEGLCAVAECLGKGEDMKYDVIPSGIFTTPEIGTVGLSEQQAEKEGFAVKTSTFQFRELGKAQAMGELPGFFKLICNAQNGKVLGAQIAGAHATDIIAEVTLGIKMGATAKDIANTIHAHPTLAEGVYEAALHLAE